MDFDFTGLITLSVSFGLAALFGLFAFIALVGLLANKRSPAVRARPIEPWKAYLATSLGFAAGCLVLGGASLMILPRAWLHRLDDTCGYWAALPGVLFFLVLLQIRRKGGLRVAGRGIAAGAESTGGGPPSL